MNTPETPSVEWVLNELHVIEQFQSRVEGDRNPSAVALRRAIEIIVQRYPTATLQSRVKELEAENTSLEQQIAALQARVKNLEYGLTCIVNDNPDSEIDVRHFAKAVLNGTVTPTTEK